MERPGQRNLELEAAAFADLDDLDSWRVFADWLLAAGDPRGEIANLAVARQTAYLSQRRVMAARMAELERPYLDAWQAWAEDRELGEVEVEIKRGFVFTLTGELSSLAPVLAELFERHPIGRLTLTEVDPEALAGLLEPPPAWLARLRYLKLAGELDATAIEVLAARPLPELRGLNLTATALGDDACPPLARLDAPQLDRLVLTANEIGDAGLAALLEAPGRGRWRDLYLASNPLGPRAVARLAAAEGLSRLTGLYLRQIEAQFAAFAPFAERSAIPTLTRLELPMWGSHRERELLARLRERFGAGLHLMS